MQAAHAISLREIKSFRGARAHPIAEMVLDQPETGMVWMACYHSRNGEPIRFSLNDKPGRCHLIH
jgi:hypothetical protein